MSQFISRVINYVAGELFIKPLARRQLFQQWAMRLHLTVKEGEKKVGEKVGKNAGNAADILQKEAGSFFTTFKNEIMKDVNKGGQKIMKVPKK